MINGLKGSLLARFDDVPELIVKCCVYYHSVGPYIPFVFLIGYVRDILKITKIQTIFKKTCGLLWNVLFAVLKIFETFNFP